MTPEEIIDMITERVQNTANVRVVFGNPVTASGVTVIPVATVKVAGGGGGGKGRGKDVVLPIEAEEESSQESGIGMGLQITARPVGYIEIRDGSARLIPTPDVTKITIGGMIASTLALVTIGKIWLKRAKMQQS